MDSVFSQKTTDWELWIVVDPSDDGTDEIAASYQSRHVHVVQRPAPGPGGYAARNAGIARAIGEYIAFLDADDEWTSFHLSRADALLRDHPEEGILVGNYERVMEDGSIRENRYGTRYRPLGDAVVTFDQYLQRARHGADLFRTSTLVAKRSAFEIGLEFPERRCTRAGDIDLFLRLMAVNYQVIWSSAITGRYHRDAPSMVTKTLAPQLAHCARPTIRIILAAESSCRGKWHAKRFYNMKVKDALRRRARIGILGIGDCGRLYSGIELPWLFMQLAKTLVVRLIQRVGCSQTR